jgi:hypothetical protein
MSASTLNIYPICLSNCKVCENILNLGRFRV